MACWTLNELKGHLGHNISLSDYAGNICIECEDCCEILMEFHEEETEVGLPILELGPKEDRQSV